MNLLEDQWIPVKNRQGEEKFIAAYEVVQADIISLNTPRADFNAALMQFLIGLIQTVYAPDDEVVWEELYEESPTESQLKESFEKIKDAFYLDGDGYRFMQDTSIKESGNTASVLKLIPSIVGDNTVKNNQDFFLKASSVNKISINSLISALYLYQNYCLSETGGASGRHHGSFRGRNTSIVIIHKENGNLWENIWLNIIQQDKFNSLVKSENKNGNFAWMSDAPNTKQKHDNDFSIKDMYWSMPRRVWLKFEELGAFVCDISGIEAKALKNIYIKENGIEYKTNFSQHPLIPYFKDSEGLHPIKIKGTGINYGDWLSLVGNDTASKNLLEHINRNPKGIFKIFVCGYLNHVQQAKTLCWYQTQMPLYGIELENEERKVFKNEVDKYIQSASKIGDSKFGYLSNAVKNAWFDENREKNKDKKAAFSNDKATEIAKSFWNNTESKFYELLKKLYQLLEQDKLNEEEKLKLKEEWYRHIKQETIALFNYWAFKSSIQTNPKRISLAYNNLMKNLNSLNPSSNALKKYNLRLTKGE